MIKPIHFIAAALLTAGAASAQQSVVGAPKPVADDSKQLTYRDPAEPITIGEMSDKQAAAETEKFLNKLGYTGVKHVEAVKSAVDAVKVEQETPPNQMKLLGVYGQDGALSADLSVNGQLHKVSGKSAAGTVNVLEIKRDGLKVSYTLNKRCPVRVQDPKSGRTVKKRVPCVNEAELAVGDSIEWR